MKKSKMLGFAMIENIAQVSAVLTWMIADLWHINLWLKMLIEYEKLY